MARGAADLYMPEKSDTRAQSTKLIIEGEGGVVQTVNYKLKDKYVLKVGAGLTIQYVIFDAVDSMASTYDPTDVDNLCTNSGATLAATCTYERFPTEHCQGGMSTGSFF
jgi:hypothetical protein